MTSLPQAHDALRRHLDEAIGCVFEPAGMRVTQAVEAERESAEYGAYRFGIDGHIVVFRVAKTTPTKVGQFVTIWKRPARDGDIAPLDARDGVGFVVIFVADAAQRGHFVFNRATLTERGIMSRDGKGGKRAIRVYPPWSRPTAKEAIRTQAWQARFFLPLAADGTAPAPALVRALFRE